MASVRSTGRSGRSCVDGFSKTCRRVVAFVAPLLFEDFLLEQFSTVRTSQRFNSLTGSTLHRSTWCHIFASHAVTRSIVEQSGA